MRMMLPLAALALTGCGIPADLPTSPGAVAETTKLDEQGALTITLAYTGAARAAALAIEAGLVSDPATIARIGSLDRTAYAAVQAVEAAYRTGNAATYAEALARGRAAVIDLLDSVKGPAK